MLGILKHYKTWTNEHGQLCICRVGSFGGTTLANFFQELSKLLESKYTEKELSKLSEVAINQIIENPL